MDYQHISTTHEGGIVVVTLSRPARRSALSLGLMQELIQCLGEIGARREVRAVILAAAGKVFCSGHDLSEMVGRDINEYRQIFDVCTELMSRIQSIRQPVKETRGRSLFVAFYEGNREPARRYHEQCENRENANLTIRPASRIRVRHRTPHLPDPRPPRHARQRPGRTVPG